MQILKTGFGSSVVASRLLVLVPYKGRALKRLKEAAGKQGKLIDLTRKPVARTLLVLDTGHVVLSRIRADTLAKRLAQ